jgi:hypothetical protein
MARWLLVVLLSLAAMPILPAPAQAQLSPGEQISLRETLEKGLRVRTDRERQYIGRVVALIDQGVLPKDLVLSVFQKARFKNRDVPIVWFRFALAKLAAEKGVEIPF